MPVIDFKHKKAELRTHAELSSKDATIFANPIFWFLSAIAEIEAAKNQDEINNIFIDPMYEEQSDPDQQRITNAAQKRESELFGN